MEFPFSIRLILISGELFSVSLEKAEQIPNSQMGRLNHKIRLIAIAFQVKMLYNRYRTGGMTYGSESG